MNKIREKLPKNTTKRIRFKNLELHFKNPVEKNRYLFLQYLERKYHLPSIKASLWKGTALHLLELTDYISPEMHQAGNYYLNLSQKILKEGPQRRRSKIAPSGSHSYIPLKDRYYNTDQEEKEEKEWKDLSLLLKEEGISSSLDKLAGDQEWSLLETLFKQQEALVQLRKGLVRLQNYLEEKY